MAFVLAILVLLAASGQAWLGLKEIQRTADRVNHTLTVIGEVRRLQGLVVDAETAARGFALTGEDAFLEPYRAADAERPPTVERLRVLTRDNAEQQQRLDQLEDLTSERLTQLRAVMEGTRRFGPGLVDAPLLRSGKATMDQVRGVLAAMVAEEERLYARQTEAARRRAAITGNLILAAVTGSLFVLTMIYLLMRREVAQRRRGEAELALLNATLDEKVEARTAELERVGRTLEREAGERARAATTLQATKELLEAILGCSPLALIGFDAERRVIGWNSRAEALFGRAKAEVIGRAVDLFAGGDAARFEALFAQALAGRSARDEVLRAGEGRGRELSVSAAPLYSREGEPRGVVLALEDVSERRLLEEQLRQAQKMEAVGQLTGGLAHDFNNLLAVIIGNLDLAAETVRDGATREPIEEALGAAQRGAELTRALLAFSRQQPLQPRAVAVADLITSLRGLLQRALGERVVIETRLAPGLGPALADPAQLEAALLNLAVNARDAMPKGGRLVIETADSQLDHDYAAVHPEVVPGRYLLVAVSDSGAGMSAETVRRAFEPFFTTKGPGEGSGLGLSMVHGFAKQSGGHVSIYSEQGFGTTVRLYLPFAQPAAEVGEVQGEASSEPRAKGETILVVEDQAEVRRIVVRQLTSLGYRVLEAEDASTAFQALRTGTPIDLLFTDVVMPGVSGIEVAAAARAARPGLRVLLTSGFADGLAGGAPVGVADAVLTKPYRRWDLARRIRSLFDDEQGPEPAHAARGR
jgi:PAS domain S-box-containing protein